VGQCPGFCLFNYRFGMQGLYGADQFDQKPIPPANDGDLGAKCTPSPSKETNAGRAILQKYPERRAVWNCH